MNYLEAVKHTLRGIDEDKAKNVNLRLIRHQMRDLQHIHKFQNKLLLKHLALKFSRFAKLNNLKNDGCIKKDFCLFEIEEIFNTFQLPVGPYLLLHKN